MTHTYRDENLDNACGILILYMIFLHCSMHFGFDNSSLARDIRYVFFFFMPWFFFKNGYYFKESDKRILLKKGYERLLKPYILWLAIGHIIYCVYLLVSGFHDWKLYLVYPVKQLFYDSAIIGNLPLWFLLSLFIVRFIANEILKLRLNLAIVLLSLGMICYLSSLLPPFKVILLSNVPTGLFFFLTGYTINNRRSTFLVKQVKNQSLIFACIILLYLSIVFFGQCYVDMRVNILWEGSYLCWLIGSVPACLAINIICEMKIFSKLGLGWIGRNSMMFYVSHWVIFYIIHTCIVILTNIGIEVPIKSFV